MSIELQIQSSTLKSITARAVQKRLLSACIAPFSLGYVDHADIAAAPIELTAANSAIRLRVPIDIFVVSREAVLAAPNAIPIGATVPAGTIFVVLEMTVIGTILSLQCIDADLGPLGNGLGPDLPAAKAAICQAVGAPAKLDLTTMLQKLEMPTPASSRIELVRDIVAIRFDPSGDVIGRLFPGQEWGMFLDVVSIRNLVQPKVIKNLKSHIPSLMTDAQWHPNGSVPHMDINYAGKAPVPDPFSGDVDGTLWCDFSLTPTFTKLLRTTVNWSLHINLGDFVPGFVDNMVEDIIDNYMDPTKFGGTPIGDHAFTLDSILPDISFGGSRFEYTSIPASPEGMTIGGSVRLSLDPGKDTLQPSVRQFGLPSRLEFCRELAKSGSGAPSKTASLKELTTNGSVWLDNLGAFCNVEVVSPGNWITPYIKTPNGSPEIRIAIPSAVALGITDPVRILVLTARGVRLIDLGTPPPALVDANGNVTNANLVYIDNCLYLPVDHGINWGLGISDLTPPLEWPDWATYLDNQLGIDVQLVTLSELEPGELIQFRSRDHAVNVTADHNGQALVPVFLPIDSNLNEASLKRVNRQNIADHFTVDQTVFIGQASLPAGVQNRLDPSVDGIGVLTTEFEDHIDIHEIGSLGAPMLLKREIGRLQESIASTAHAAIGHLGEQDLVQHEPHNATDTQMGPSSEEIALNPQPLPPKELGKLAGNPLLAQKINLPDIKSLIAVPGFAEAPIALALMADSSTLVLGLGDNGSARVAGTFTGPIGDLDVSGDWAIGVGPSLVTIFRVTGG